MGDFAFLWVAKGSDMFSTLHMIVGLVKSLVGVEVGFCEYSIYLLI